MGGPKEIVPTYFCAEKIVTRKSIEVISMKKGDSIDTFLGGLNEIRDQLTAIEATSDQELMVRTSLNVVSEDWEVFVQSILGRGTLPPWDNMWAPLR